MYVNIAPIEDLKQLIGDRLARLRVSEGGITQRQAAARVGVAERMWQRWESGNKKPNTQSQERIRAAFDLQEDFFSPEPKVVSKSDVEQLLDEFAEVKNILRELKRRDDARWDGLLAAVELERLDPSST